MVPPKGVGHSTTLAWPGWKQPDIPVEVDTARLETSRTDTVKELPGYSVQNCPSGNFAFWVGAVGRGRRYCEKGIPQGTPWTVLRTPVSLRILSTSFISVSIFSVCCYSSVSISMAPPVRGSHWSLWWLQKQGRHPSDSCEEDRKCPAHKSIENYCHHAISRQYLGCCGLPTVSQYYYGASLYVNQRKEKNPPIIFKFTRQRWSSTTFGLYLALLVWRSNIRIIPQLNHLLHSSCNKVIFNS